jgi:hypothetical protein
MGTDDSWTQRECLALDNILILEDAEEIYKIGEQNGK